MTSTNPRFVLREDLFASRPRATVPVRFSGLWCCGSFDALARPTVAIVGSRAPSAGGAARARALGAALSRAGICVISGLALGIDGAAHLGALEGRTPTIGVLGGGHRHFFPKLNRDLGERMVASGGAVLSPFAPDEPARPGQFLERNGVVAALADAVVVVEAALRSGALNTASWAAQIGLDVFAYPGDVDRAIAAGCNALIRDGATLVRDAVDVLEGLGLTAGDAPACTAPPTNAAAGPGRVEDPLQRSVLEALVFAPLTLDELTAQSGAAPGDLISAVVQLEIAGEIVRRDGSLFALAQSERLK